MASSIGSKASQLRDCFGGEIIYPDDPGYAQGRTLWKGVDRRPALIARCRDVPDIRQILDFAKDNDIRLAVMNTGHDVAGRSVIDDGIVLSMRNFQDISIDPRLRLARVGSGVRWGDLVGAASTHGLATTGASVATVGVAGFSLHGGFGWLMRRCGIGCDNIVGLDVVTADGKLRTVTDLENPDLFWAMRGAGANFGVVTSLTLRLHQISRVIAGVKVYPASQVREVLQAYTQITASAPDSLVTHFYYMGNADGSHSVGIGICLIGSAAMAGRLLAPLSALGPPVEDSVRERDLVDLQAVHDSSTPPGGQYAIRAYYLNQLAPESITALIEHCRLITGPLTKVFIEHLGGAIRSTPSNATAFWGRDAEYSLLAIAGWTDSVETDVHTKWAQEFGDRMSEFAIPGSYVNYLDDEEDHRIADAYGPGYPRLTALKSQLDPANLFQSNRNIRPRR
jgi:FAD/FMN-containing dehydrogenase